MCALLEVKFVSNVQVDALVCASLPGDVMKEGTSIGYSTVQYLFQLGAGYYKR